MKVYYNWTLKDANFTKDKGKVFSCFACGGGSTMGYKLAGFDVIGCNEIDPKMMELYIENHKPKYSFLEPIQTFKNREDLPKELFELDILDGSPPCSSFSMAGNREKDWGKEKKFREGQAKQVLDDLFFHFIDLAKRLQPKIVIAENVKGLLLGNAKKYVKQIYKEFDLAGYHVQHFLLDASKMGVPQRRERVFFVALRKDLSNKLQSVNNLFLTIPKLELNFKEKEIPFKDIEDKQDTSVITHTEASKLWEKVKYGQQFSKAHKLGYHFNCYKVNPNKVLNTVTATTGNGAWHYSIQRPLNDKENILAGSFPQDYNFKNQNVKYVIGMSVPPLMTARISNEIYNQWLKFLK